jgi:flagellar capping protein FliD
MAESSSSSSSLEMSGNRMAGMMSGLDTAALVESMTAATLKRLEKQKAKSQQLTWKQEGYRDIIEKLNEFQEKYTSVTSSTSLRLRSNLMKAKATSSDSRVTATAGSSAEATTYTIKKAQSSKTTTMQSNNAISNGTVKLDLSKVEADKDYTIKLTLDGNMKEITFKGGASADQTAQNLEDAINADFSKTFGTGQSFVLDSSGKLIFNDGSDGVSHNFVVGYNETFGLKNDTSSRMSTSFKLGDIGFAAGSLSGDSLFGFEINGVAFGFTKDDTLADVITEVNSSEAGAKLSFDQMSGKLTLMASESGAGGELDVKQTSGNLLNMLFNDSSIDSDSASVSNKMSYDSYGAVSATTDRDMILDIGMDGITDSTVYSMNLKIDGNDYTITADSSSFPEKTGDKKTYDWAEFEAIFTEQIKDQYTANYKGTGPSADEYFAGFTIKATSESELTFTDNNKKIELETGTGFTADSAKSSNVTVNLFNYNTVVANNDGGVDGDGDGNIDPKEITFNLLAGSTMSESSVTIKGTAADGSVTMRDLVNSGLFSYDLQGYLTAKQNISTTTGSAEAVEFMNKWFTADPATGLVGSETDAFDDNVAKTNLSRGADAKLTLLAEDGVSSVTYQNANDNFTINGTTINISGLKNFESSATEPEITVGVTKDTSAVKDLIKDFVEGYNQLLDDVREYYDASRPKSSGSYYEPLTEAQKKDMSSEEIEKWESQAKIGLLADDDNIRRVLDDLHAAMNTVVDGFQGAAAGIELTDSFLDNNKFKLNEDKLDNALAKYGDKLANFFTDPENGLASKLNKAIDKMADTSSTSSGYLVREAGVAGTPSERKSQMYIQQQQYQDLIDQITERYKKQQESDWKRFTALETYLAKMNEQASMFVQ